MRLFFEIVWAFVVALAILMGFGSVLSGLVFLTLGSYIGGKHPEIYGMFIGFAIAIIFLVVRIKNILTKKKY